MLTFTKEEAIERAQTDWQNQSARWLSIGLMSWGNPAFSPNSVFYAATLGCDWTEEKAQFCAAYNQAIQELVDLHGVPDWSPQHRFPDRHEALQWLSEYRLFPEIHDLPLSERSLVQSRAGDWKQLPLIWTKVAAKQIILLGGNHSDRCGWVDVIDTKEKTWMARFQYRRRHVPVFPWDTVPKETN